MRKFGKNFRLEIQRKLGALFIAAFCLLNICNYLSFYKLRDTKIEVLSSLISKTANDFSPTKSINMNFFNKSDNDRNSIYEMVTLAREMSANMKSLGPHYNARVAFTPADNNYYYSNMLVYKNPSIILSSIFSNHLNDKNEVVHDVFELKLMFKAPETDISSFDNFCYITQDDADYIISQKPIYNSYADLIGASLDVEYRNSETAIKLKWKISNIILKEEGIDSFLKNTYGSYILTYLKFPSFDMFSFDFDFGVSITTNINKINSLQSFFTNDNYTYGINNINVSNAESRVLEEIISIFSETNTDSSTSSLPSWIIISISALIAALYLIVYFYMLLKQKMIIKRKTLFLYLFSFFVIYYFFKILAEINVYFVHFFSFASIILNLFFTFIIFLGSVVLMKKRFSYGSSEE